MTTETFIIEIRERGAAATAASIQNIEKTASKTADTLAFFRKALVAFSAIRIASNVVEFADASTRLSNRLKVATKSTEEFVRAQGFVSKISRETRTDLEGNAVVYARLLRSTDSLKFSTEDLEQVMKGLAFSVKVGGATSMEAKNAMIQFTQSLASGALRGDELRSVAEQLPALATAIGKEFGKTGGELIAFAKANPGILETEKVLRGVMKAANGLAMEAAQMTPTMQEAFIVIKNSVTEMLMEVNEGVGVFTAVNRVLLVFADNMSTVAQVTIAFIAIKLGTTLYAHAAAFVAANNVLLRYIITGRIATAVQYAFNLAVSRNPYVAAAIAIAAFILILVKLYQTFPVVQQAMDAVWGVMKSVASYIITGLKPAFDVIMLALNALKPAFTAIGEVLYASLEGWRALVQVWNDTVGAYTPMGIILNNLGPLLTGVGYVIMAVLVAAFTALITVMRGVTEVMYAFNLVSDETMAKVRESSNAWYKYVLNIGEGGPAFAAAELSQKKLADATKSTGTAATGTAIPVAELSGQMDALGQVAGKPVAALDSLSKSSYKTSESTRKTSESFGEMGVKLVKVEEVSTKAMAAFNKLNPTIDTSSKSSEAAVDSYQEAAGGLDTITSAARRAIKALEDLARAQSKVAVTGSGGLSNNITGKAAGGPVKSGTQYLVGENGPELFTPNASGTIVPNHDLVGGTGPAFNSSAANNNSGMDSVAKSVKLMANAVNKWTMTDYKSASGVNQVTYQSDAKNSADDVMYQRRNKYLENLGTPGVNKLGQTPLPGDADYRSSSKNMLTGQGGTNRLTNSGYVATTYDEHKPMDKAVAEIRNLVALGRATQSSYDSIVKRQEEYIQKLKDIRDTTASFKAYVKTIPEQMKTNIPQIDFQTLLPYLGGKSFNDSDPYGIMKAASAQEQAGRHVNDSGQLAEGASEGNASQAPRITVNIAAKDINSFRDNQAQIESRFLGAVKRAQRRAG